VDADWCHNPLDLRPKEKKSHTKFELEILKFMLCNSLVSNMHIFVTFLRCQVVMSSLSDWITHTIAFMYSDHVYKVGFWVKMSAGMNYCVFSNVINTSYHRQRNKQLSYGSTWIQFCRNKIAKQMNAWKGWSCFTVTVLLVNCYVCRARELLYTSIYT